MKYTEMRDDDSIREADKALNPENEWEESRNDIIFIIMLIGSLTFFIISH